jgi:hypothetical protein
VYDSDTGLRLRTPGAVTDTSGLYRITDLRPGIYMVRLWCPGWQAFQVDGVELPGSLTATVNVRMEVAGHVSRDPHQPASTVMRARTSRRPFPSARATRR